MANRPTPVIVVSNTARRERLPRFLELEDAVDFVAKPDAGGVDAAEVLDGLCRRSSVSADGRSTSGRASFRRRRSGAPRRHRPANRALAHRHRRVYRRAVGAERSFLASHRQGSYGIVAQQPERPRTFAQALDRKLAACPEAIDVTRSSGAFVCPGGNA
jgi:chemotaxis response regulator CheB